MANTESDVRAVIVDAVRDIAVSELGFIEPNGNIKEYLLAEEVPERANKYLYGKIEGGRQAVRAWGVQVYANETLKQSHTLATMREYNIVLEGYYGGDAETPVNTAIYHARKVRKAVNDLGGRLGGTVQAIIEFTKPDIDWLVVPDVGYKVLRIRMILNAEKRNADW